MSLFDINRLIEIDKQYKMHFSTTFETNQIIRFTDNQIHDMYSHNFTYIKTSNNKKELVHLVNKEITKRINEGKTFAQIEFDNVYPSYDTFDIKPEVTVYDYMLLDLSKEISFRYNTDVITKKAVSDVIINEGIDIDVEINGPFMEFEWARKRMNRKTEIYKNETLNLNFYVGYLEGKAVGKCDFLESNDIAKIEDFDVHQNFRGIGVGSAMVHAFIKHARSQSYKYIYLITDKDDKAKHIYAKLGFKKVGEKTELHFKLT